MLWLALWLPQLPVSVYTRTQKAQLPLAVIEGKRLLAVNLSARRLGIEPEMSLGAAHALAPTLAVLPRNLTAEQETLERLAGWALQFTSWVSLQQPNGLLLEIAGSLRLFNGLSHLVKEILAGLRALGLRARYAIAPTPSGAWLLCQGKQTQPACDTDTLHAQLSALPCEVLALDKRQHKHLTALGLYRLGDCLKQPRAGFSRRFGLETLEQLDRAFGYAPDPRHAYSPPPRFRRKLMLPAPVAETEPLLFALRRLLLELEGYLRGRDAGVQQLRILLSDDDALTQSLDIRLLTPQRAASHLLMLARHRLEHTPLTAPAECIQLITGRVYAYQPTTNDLLDIRDRVEEDDDLLERFHARLGKTPCMDYR
ncbi:DNA polymerase Y family protein [Alkalilimnicola ehrlichii]|uniref:UmuC domain-containing protein n=1 Tax=Alkalilimnicola ehrlichii TaxID=351052 RepID=A0A3E0WLW4_9GAMM|nr:DNA polymerase Y family protein [Alkalilimnicola ehrlichii]RFA33798.1 hypothetical protein CAL65_16870 [Alkalilimnicola ehrlichii]